jgi:general secretion pathway protein I
MKTRSEAGFTLLEVLVAMTVLAMGIAFTVSLVSNSLSNIKKVDARARIVDHAKSVMELVLLDQEIRGPAAFDGDFADGTRWIMRIEEYVPDEQEFHEQVYLPVTRHVYTVEMFRPGSSVVDYRLSTLKVVPVR